MSAKTLKGIEGNLRRKLARDLSKILPLYTKGSFVDKKKRTIIFLKKHELSTTGFYNPGIKVTVFRFTHTQLKTKVRIEQEFKQFYCRINSWDSGSYTDKIVEPDEFNVNYKKRCLRSIK